MPHLPALDGLRAIAILAVLAYHSGLLSGGFVGVDLFFALSGFLITRLLVAEHAAQGDLRLPLFWARRALRLVPALVAALVLAVGVSRWIEMPLEPSWALATLLYGSNLLIGWGHVYPIGLLSHTWSLAMEEQFYLLWPPIVLAVLLLCRRRFGNTASYVAVGAVALVGSIASAVWMVHLYTPGADPSRVYYGTDTRAQAMLMGAVLSVIVLVHGPLRSRAARLALVVASPLCLVFVVAPWFAGDATWIHDFFYGRYGLLLYSVATCVVLWRLVQPASGALGAGLSWAPVRWVGGISYEMYLWHWPTYLVLTSDRTGLSGGTLFAVRIATVVLLAWVTHVLVDEPIRKGVRLHSPQVARIAAAAMVIALGVGVFGATVGAQPALSGKVGQLADNSAPPTVPERVSGPNPAQPSLAPGATSTTAPSGPVKLLVVGDSQAATLAQGVQAAPGVYGLSHLSGYSVWNRAILGCPIISAPTFRFDGNDIANKCGGAGYWQQQWADDVAQFRPDAVVAMAGAWDVFDVVQPDGSILHPGDPEWVTMYTRDVRELFRTLGSTGAAVVAIRPPCWGESTLIGTDAQIAERMDAARVRAVADVWEKVAAEEGATLLDLDATLCPGGTADPAIRPDGAHFSGAGADRVAAPVAKAVQRALATAALGANG